MSLYYFFLWNQLSIVIVLFFGCGHCIIFRGSHTKGKHSVQLIFVGILVPGRLGHVIVLFFRPGQPGIVIVLFVFAGTGWPMSLYYFPLARPGWSGSLYYFHLAAEK